MRLKHFLSVFLALLFVFSGHAWAADQVYQGTVAKVDANGNQTMNGVAWTITSDNTSGLGQSVNATKGAQIGSGSKPTRSLTFETTGIAGTIKEVVVNTSGASGFTGTVSVTVGSTAFLCSSSETASLTTSAADYTFKGEATGKITIAWAQPSTSKAIYVKTIKVTYGEGSSCENTVSVTKVTPVNGDFDISATEVCGDGDGGEVTISNIESATGYTLDEVSVTVGTYNSSTGKVTGINDDTEITVTFKSLPKYTVSFNVGGSTASQEGIEEASAGAGITLPAGPTPTCSDDWAFAGWAEAAVGTQTTVAPTLLSAGDTYHPTSNTTLYAVYSKTEEGGGVAFARYEKVDFGGTITDGKYLISTGSFTMSGSARSGASFTPGTTENTDYEYTIAISGEVFTIKGPDNKYITGANSNTGLSFGTDEPTVDAGKWKYNASGIQNQGFNTRYIRAYQTQDFRHYTTSNGSDTYLYKRVEGSGSTTYYLSAPTCSTPSCEKLGTPVVSVPAAYLTYNSAKLTWGAVTNAVKYVVKFAGTDHETTDLFYDATGLDAATNYSYQVKAVAAANQDDYCDGEFSASANFTTLAAPAVAVDPASKDFGTVATDAEISQVFSVSGSNLVAGDLTIAVPSGYSVSPSSISVTEATLAATEVTVSKNTTTAAEYNGNMTISGCGLANAVEVALSMTVAEKYTVSFNTGAGNPEQAAITEASVGAGITLPAGPTPKCSADGWAFAGWVAEAVDEETTTAPTLLSETYNPTGNVTLYAVYQRTEEGGGVAFARYEKVTSNPEDWSGKYLLAANTSGTTYYTFSGKTGATAGGSTEHTPGTTEKTGWEVTVAKTTNGYSLYHGGEYLGLTSDGNNLNFSSTFTANNYEWTLSYDKGAQSNAYTTRYIECNTSSSYKVACYKASQKRFYLYKRIEEAASTTYYLSAPDCCTPYEAPALSYTTPLQKDGDAVNPTWASDPEVTVTYASSNTDAVTVDPSTGAISPIGAGTAVITASWVAQNGKCAGSKESNAIVVNGDVLISFNGSGADGSMEAQSVPVGIATALKANEFTAPACKQFGGWATEAEGAKVYDNEGNITASSAMTLYAVWNTIQYTVAEADAHVGAASVELSANSVDCGGSITVTATADATHKGDPTITFDGTATLDGNQITNIQSNITNMKVTYVEKDQFAITWNVNGEALTGEALTGVTTSVYEGGEIANLPSVADDVLACTNKFMGWSRKNANTVPQTTAYYDDLFTTGAGAGAINKAETFYAVFAKSVGTPIVEIFSEDFAALTDGSISNPSSSAISASDLANFSGATRAYAAGEAVKLGGSSNNGSLTTNELTIAAGTIITISFDVAGWSTVEGNIDITSDNEAFSKQSVSYSATKSDDLEHKSIEVTVAVANPSLTFATSAKRAFLDNIVITSGGATISNYVTKCAAVAAPTFSVEAGTYDAAQTVELSCETENAEIRYTTNGDNPTSTSTLYESAIAVNQSMTIKAISIKDAVESEVVSAQYTLKVATPTISGETSFFDKTTVTLESATEGATIKYCTDGQDPLGEYENPVVFDLYNSAIIATKAVKAGWEDSETKEVTFTKIVPKTVAEARDIIDNGTAEQKTGVYARGIVSEIVTAYSSEHGNITYNISEDGLTTSDQLQAYRGKGKNGANFTSENDVMVGDEVVIYGNLKKYNSTYEFDQNNQLVERKQRVLSIALSGDYMTECNEGAEFSHEGMVVTASYNYGDDADVTASASWTTPDLSVAGEKTITVSYTFNGKTVTEDYTITVNHECTTEVIVTKGEEVNGTFAIAAGAVCGDEPGAEIEVTAIVPSEGYRFKEITATVGTVDNDLKKVTGITAATTITVVFEEIPSYTINYSVGGNSGSTNANEGTSILAALPANPTSCDATNYPTFYGWKAGAIEGLADDAPAILDGEALVSSATPDVTYYAVFTNAVATDYSTTYTSNVTLSATGGTKATASSASINETEYVAMKLGTSGNAGNFKISVPSGTVKLYLHALGWNGKSNSLTLSTSADGVTLSPSEAQSLTSNAGVSGSTSTYELSEIVNDLFEYTLTGVSEETEITVACSERCLVWGVNASNGISAAKYLTTCTEPTCEHLAAPTLDGDVLVDQETAIITWTAVEHASSYVLNITQGETAIVTNESVNDLAYEQDGLTAGTTYHYTVMAVGDGATYCAENNELLEGDFTTESATPAESATLTLSENGEEVAFEGEHNVGDVVTLPSTLSDPTHACTGKVLVGWSSVAIAEPGDMPAESYWAAGEEFTLSAAEQTLYAVYATAGAGAANTLFSETFDNCEGTGGNDESWSGSIASGTLSLTGWTCVKGNAADGCAKFGTGSALGSAQTPAIEVTGAATLTFRAGAWNGGSESTNLKLSATGATLDKASVTLVKGAFTEYTVAITGAEGSVKIKFEGNSSSNSRFFLDDVIVSQSSVAYSAYTTSCVEALAVPTFNVAGGEFTTAQTIVLSAVEDATIYYTTDGTNPTTESDVYNAAIVLDVCGTTTIKAFAKKDAQESEIVSETYIINFPITNTAETAYTPAQAIAIVDGACDKSEAVYVKGVVTLPNPTFNGSLTNAAAAYNGTYNVYVKAIGDDSENPAIFEFYRMWKDGESTAFVDGEITVGDTLVATGTLTKYNTTYEFNAGCYMVEHHAYVAEKEHIANTQETAYTVAQAIGFCDNALTYDLSDEVYVKGVAIAAPNSNGTFNIHDANVENSFQIYKSVLSEELQALEVAIEANDTIIAKGTILKYNADIYEMNQGGIVVEVKKYVPHTIAVNPIAVAFGEVEQNETVDAISFNAYLTNVASATVTLGGTNASAFSINKDALTENDIITVSVASTDLELGEYAATITISDDANVAEDAVVNVTMTIIAPDSRKKAQDLDGFEAVSGDLNAEIAFASTQGDGTAVPALSEGKILYYQPGSGKAAGGYMTLTAVKGCTIDQVKVVTADNNSTKIKYSKDGGELSEATDVEAGANYLTPASLGAQTVNIYCAGADKNHRLYVAQVVVYYTGEAQAIDHYTVDASAVVTTEFKKNATFSSEGLKVYACYAMDESDNVDITEQCNVVADLSTEGAKKAEVYLGEQKLGEYDINVISGQENPALAYTPSELTIPAVEVGSWSAPVLSNPFNVTPIYSSNNTAVATVSEDGVIALAGGIGTAVIKATFAETEDYIASEATYTITVQEPANKIEGDWRIVASASDISIGSKVIIANIASGTSVKTMGAVSDNGKFRVEVASEVDGEGILSAADGTKTFTLVDAGNGLYAFQANNGKYLSAASSGSNDMKEVATIDANASWSISIAEGVATIKAQGSYSRNWLRYNQQNTRFSCYGSGQQDIALYVNRTVIEGSDDPANPAVVVITDDVTEEEIVASGNVVLTVNQTFDEPKSYIAQNGATIIINNGTSSTEAKSIIADENSTIEITKPTTVNEIFYVAAHRGQGSAEHPTSSSTILNAAQVHIASPAQFDFTLAVSGEQAAAQWHDFSVPFPVDALKGVYGLKNGEWKKLTNEVDYAILDFHADVRANGQYSWKKCRGIMQPGKIYSLTVNGDIQTFRFMKTEADYTLESQKAHYWFFDGDGAVERHGWNGLGNSRMQEVSIAGGIALVYVLVYDENYPSGGYKAVEADKINLMIGSAFLIQTETDDVDVAFGAPNSGEDIISYAPARNAAKTLNKVKVTFSDGRYTDNLYLSASEEATNSYQIGKDLVKLFATDVPAVPTFYTTNYNGIKLASENAPLNGEHVEYALTLYAPTAGEYTLETSKAEDADLYLTYDGTIIWNLSAGDYTLDLEKGTTEGYGLMLKAKAPQEATGVEDVQGDNVQCTKVIIDENVYILRGEKLYDVTGKMVK